MTSRLSSFSHFLFISFCTHSVIVVGWPKLVNSLSPSSSLLCTAGADSGDGCQVPEEDAK